MDKYTYRISILGVLLLAFLSNLAMAYDDLLYSCQFSGNNGDQTTRGFYVENYPSTTLGGVVIGLGSIGNTGVHSITLHARENTYDGNLIGSVSQDLNLTSTNTQFDFDFADAAVTPGSTVAFIIQVTSDPINRGFAYYDVGAGVCDDVTQTNGTTPPLDTFRRGRIGLSLFGLSGDPGPQVTYSVGGDVSGLTGTGLALQNNGVDTLAVAADGPFTFLTELADAAAYAVSVSTQPTGQTCTVTNGNGTISTADVTNVSVTCVDDVIPTYSVGGNVSGLTGTGLALQNNGADTLAIASDGPFTFLTDLVDAANYAVTVSTQPAGQTCTVTDGNGTIATSDVTDVAVTCTDNVAVAPPEPAVPVPTLSQWALILLSMLLGVAVFNSRRRFF